MNRLRTINECLNHEAKGPVKSIYGSVGISLAIDDESDNNKVIATVWANVDTRHAQLNESIDQVASDKMELLRKDVQMIMDDVQLKLNKVIEKYGFNRS